MKKKPGRISGKTKPVSPSRRKSSLALWGIALLAIAAVGVWFGFRDSSKPATQQTYVKRPAGSVTFNKDIAPILYERCANCHRPGQSAPFDLVAYSEVTKRAREIGRVTHSRFMPPWLPEDGFEPFLDERRLSAKELGLIEQWIADGTPEGSPADLPPMPKWSDGWQFGVPELVVNMPETYTLPANGKDVYRNFVFPVPLTEKRYVRAIEFRAGTKALHHALIRVDRSRQSRRLDQRDAEPGFGGMETPPNTEDAGGHFMSWQPGRGPTRMPDGLSWPLLAGSDLVVQMHMQITGKAEPIRPSIGLYFTDQAPTNVPFKISLLSYAIDIPAGSRDFELRDSYVLPVDVDLLAVLPHAHYLGKRLEGLATLPDGSTRTLLLIKDWDFNWQSDYRYAQPVFLPKGTRLSMRYTYDNSVDNVRNPNQPPQRVKYGLQSTDEMGELWLQVLTRNRLEREKLEVDYARRVIQGVITYNRLALARDTNNAHAHTQLGKALMAQGRMDEALAHFQTATRLQPNQDEAHYHIGVIALDRQHMVEAESEFQLALQANPEFFRAHNNLGLVYLRQSRLAEAEACFNEVLRLNPGDAIAEGNLRIVAQSKAAKP